jgi:hypothetical protein
MHNWVHGSSALDWRVNEQQFFAALNATVRSTKRDPATSNETYSWCDACAVFAPHDGRSCATVGAVPQNGVCMGPTGEMDTSMTSAQMVAICAQNPVSGFVGPVPAATDPTSACTFTGCPARSALSGTPGNHDATCVACGPHQVSVGTVSCSNCASSSVAGSSCVDCGANELVGGPDGNTCVACPLHQVPNAARSACGWCGWRQVAVNGSCQACPAGMWAAPDETCQPCPAGQVPYRDRCIPRPDCTCDANHCAGLDGSGLVCVDVIG